MHVYTYLLTVVCPAVMSLPPWHAYHIMQDWPPTFSSYNKIKYFWFVFVFLNSIWIFVPIYFYYDVYRRLNKALSAAKYKLD